jgi:multimeric flavodoxin WrbA
MEPARDLIDVRTIRNGADEYHLALVREDFSALYPHMVRYELAVRNRDRRAAVFRTNTFEYSPLSPLAAETVAREKADLWVDLLERDPSAVFREYADAPFQTPRKPAVDLVLIQGSPRPDGNCGILASWAADAARKAGRTFAIIYPHDLDIHCCIGCYQCYNTGSCVFDDDMAGIIDAVRGARVVIVCSPVYTNTVTGALKLVIDRMQAWHAERTLYGGGGGQKGLLFSVAGRKGEDNFTCVTRVVKAFFLNCGIAPEGEVLIDNVDAVRDIREITGKKESVCDLVYGLL